MAHKVAIARGSARVKLRSPWAAALLPYVTLGIYHFVWWYRINCELRDYGRARGEDLGQSPARSVLALFPGFLLILPPLVTYVHGARRLQAAARLACVEPLDGLIGLIMYLMAPAVLYAYIQVCLNAVWRSEARALPAQRSLPALGAQTQPARPAQPASTQVMVGRSR